jgi:hypothetical protein
MQSSRNDVGDHRRRPCQRGERGRRDRGARSGDVVGAAGLAEQALPGPDHDRVNEQPQLTHEVVLDQLKPSSPSGSWMTPSSDTFVLMTIFPIAGSPSCRCFRR